MLIPRYFQKAAAELAVRELRQTDRATVVMCCGAGKTFTGALTAQLLDARIFSCRLPRIM